MELCHLLTTIITQLRMINCLHLVISVPIMNLSKLLKALTFNDRNASSMSLNGHGDEKHNIPNGTQKSGFLINDLAYYRRKARSSTTQRSRALK